jgi:hypothetical protein
MVFITRSLLTTGICATPMQTSAGGAKMWVVDGTGGPGEKARAGRD